MAELEAPQEVNVIVIRDSGAVRATVKDPTKTPWDLVDERGERVKWRVLAYAPPLPLVFETREKALQWAERDACAKYFDLSFLTNPVGPTASSQSTADRTP